MNTSPRPYELILPKIDGVRCHTCEFPSSGISVEESAKKEAEEKGRQKEEALFGHF
jgi:hypothetical protein